MVLWKHDFCPRQTGPSLSVWHQQSWCVQHHSLLQVMKPLLFPQSCPASHSGAGGWAGHPRTTSISSCCRTADTCQFARAVMAQYQRLAHLNNRNLFSQFWMLKVQDERAGSVGFFWGLTPWLVGGHCLLVSSHDLLLLYTSVSRFPLLIRTSVILD